MSKTDVLILTQDDDLTAEYLLPYLKEESLSWVIWDPGNVPVTSEIGFELADGIWEGFDIEISPGHSISLNDIGVIWIRRPSYYHAPWGTPTDSLTRFVNLESRAFLRGFLQCAPCPIVNPPLQGNHASIKAVQLSTAHKLGFNVPQSYMGNNPEAVRRLWNKTCGHMILKGYTQGAVEMEDGSERGMATSVVEAQDLASDENISACPSIWQEYIDKDIEIRATVLGNEVLAAEIHSQNSEKTKHDWRNYDFDNTPHYPHQLPKEMTSRCIALVRELGLVYGAIDLVLTPKGEYYFLEINPSGQWAWLQDLCELPIAQAHCRLFKQLIDGSFQFEH